MLLSRPLSREFTESHRIHSSVSDHYYKAAQNEQTQVLQEKETF